VCKLQDIFAKKYCNKYCNAGKIGVFYIRITGNYVSKIIENASK